MAASIKAKFEQILWERFRNVLEWGFIGIRFYGFKDSEKHAIDIQKKVRFGNALSSHSGLIPFENCVR